MVSTRGGRYKFSEGERVLCYEPDPTKAKVLYDSKVLEVIENKDKRGRRTVEYLIHFQGWNSSWDRCVSEDFVLKDTEENRQLQRDLADKSQLQLGAYLYRRERKKGSSSTTGTGPSKRSRLGFSDDGSSTSTQPDEGEIGDSDLSSGEGSGSQSHSPPPSTQGRAQITLPSALRDRLTFDYHLVVKRGLVSRLPATPCAAQILESFVKWFARAGAWHPAHTHPARAHRPDLRDVCCRLNLVREVADGLRVYFDFVLRGHLLYKQEHNQYHQLCGKYLNPEDTKTEESEEIPNDVAADAVNQIRVEEIIKSPKLPDLPPLPPLPASTDSEKNGGSRKEGPEQVHSKDDGNDDAAKEKPMEKTETTTEEIHCQPIAVAKSKDSRSAKRSGNLARRLRSHKSAISQSENEEPGPSTSGEPRAFETLSSSVDSSGSSLSESWSRGGATQSATAAPLPAVTRTPLSLLLDKVSKWQIIPCEGEGTERLPCRVYGAIHLARLFVKLPDFLNATQMPDFKLKLIIKHVDMFVQFLDEHSEWFGEMFYIADSQTRSH